MKWAWWYTFDMVRRAFIACMFLTAAFGGVLALSSAAAAQDLTPAERAALQAQYDQLQKEIEAQQKIIKETQAKKNTLQGDVTLLNAQIKAAQSQIDAKNIVIKQLAAQIAKKSAVIGQLSDRIERGLLLCFSELHTREEIDALVAELRSVNR